MTGSEIFVSLAIVAVCASMLEAALALLHYVTWPFAWAFQRRTRRYLRPKKAVVVVAPRAADVPVSLDSAAHAAVAVPPIESLVGPRAATLADAAVKPLDFAAVYRAEQAILHVPSAERSPEKMAEFKAMMAVNKVNADTPMLADCRCRHCIEARGPEPFPTFVVCPTCGNKRCPKADNHRFDCSGSNDLGQYPRIDGKLVEP